MGDLPHNVAQNFANWNRYTNVDAIGWDKTCYVVLREADDMYNAFEVPIWRYVPRVLGGRAVGSAAT